MRVKTSDLTDAALDWAVAHLEGWKLTSDGIQPLLEKDSRMVSLRSYSHSTNWTLGGPIIEREEISIEFNRADFTWLWTAYKLGLPDEDNPEGGPTPLIAAMRCYVAFKLGDEVDVPEELV